MSPARRASDELEVLVLDAIAHFGDASEGQIAGWVAAPTPDVQRALARLYSAGRVALLPRSENWVIVGGAS